MNITPSRPAGPLATTATRGPVILRKDHTTSLATRGAVKPLAAKPKSSRPLDVLSRLTAAARTFGEACLSWLVSSIRCSGQACVDLFAGFWDLCRGRGTSRLFQSFFSATAPTVTAGLQLLSAGQTLLGVEKTGRCLTSAERDAARAVFGPTVDLSKVRIKEGSSGLLTITDCPWCLGNTIYMPHGLEDRALLVHELTHVWQYQHAGASYLAGSLHARIFGDGYDFGKGLRAGRSFVALNVEQQASLLEQAFRQGCFDTTRRFSWGGRDWTAALREGIAYVRGTSRRASALSLNER